MPKIKVFPEGEISLATQLRYFRKKLGLSQSEMAEKMGVSQSLYTKLEVNAASTTTRRIEKMAEALHTSTEFLLHGTGPEVVSGEEFCAPRLTDELLEQILTLAGDPEIRSAAEKIAEVTQRTPIQTLVTLVKAMVVGDH